MKLKEALTSAPVLVQPDFGRSFTIQCDASRVGVGGVLTQTDIEGREHPVAYVSQKLNKNQKNYTVTELECLAAIVCLKKFRPYVEGLPFKIVTDHSSLRWLMSQKDLSGRLGRWSLMLQSFDFEVEFRKGSANTVPDALSRLDVDEFSITPERVDIDLKSPFFNSEEYEKLRNEISESPSNFPDSVVSEGYIYQRIKFRKGEFSDEMSLWRLWLPKGLHHQVIKLNHDIQSCHGGFAKTLNRIRETFFWPKMSRDIKAYISNCEVCKLVKPPNKTLRPPMGRQIITERPFQRIYMDLLGPYPRTKMGNSSVFVAIDHFTKYIFLKPLKKATSSAIIKFLEESVFHQFGVPQFIHSDNGKQFVSSQMSDFLKVYGVTHIKTALYSPQANVFERTNREFLVKLRILITEKQDKWDMHVSRIANILRGDYHDALKCSPYFCTFGYNMITHGSAYHILQKLDSLNEPQSCYIPNDCRMFTLHEKVRENLVIAHEKATKSYNLRSSNIDYKPGQDVLRKIFQQSDMKKGINAKLLQPYIKCRIRKKVGSSYYELETIAGKYIGMYHGKDLKPL